MSDGLQATMLKVQSKTRRGVALILTLFAVLIAVTLSASFLTAQSTTMSIARNVQNHAQARYVAESGLELTISHLKATSTWRSDHPSGTWLTDSPFAQGTFTVKGEDGIDTDGNWTIDGDGNLADDAGDPLTLTVTGNVNGATHVVRSVVTPPSTAERFGFDTPFTGEQNGVRQKQIATRVNLPQNGTVTSISIYTKGPPPKDLRLAIYTDSAGEPGTLVVQSGVEDMGSNLFYWHTVNVTPTALTAGDYWLALCFEHDNSYYVYQSTGGQTRYNNNDAVAGGFSASWGASSTSNTRQISIYATYSPESGGSGSEYQVAWQEQP